LLVKRWKVNGLDVDLIKDGRVLDMGCSSGRYSYALKKMGAGKVIALGSEKQKKNWPEGIAYKQGSLTGMPFENEYFDFVFCNGQLSHINDWEKGIDEAYRVIKKDGWLWLSLYGKGMNWEYADSIRLKMTNDDRDNFTKALLLRDWKPNKINFLSELFFCDVRIYFTRKQIDSILTDKGFDSIRFLERGLSTDLNEKIYNDPSLKKIYGEGELRVIARKSN